MHINVKSTIWASTSIIRPHAPLHEIQRRVAKRSSRRKEIFDRRMTPHAPPEAMALRRACTDTWRCWRKRTVTCASITKPPLSLINAFYLIGGYTRNNTFLKILKKKVPADRTGPYACNDNLSPQPKTCFCLIIGGCFAITLFTSGKDKKNRVDELARHTGDKARVHNESREGEQ